MKNYALFVNTAPVGSTATNYVQLDTRDEDPLKLNFSVGKLEDPTVIASTYSGEFTLPNTQRNGQVFKTAFNVNGTDFDPSLKLQSYVTSDGVTFASGYMVLASTYLNVKNETVLYKVQFFGEVSDLSSSIGDGVLCEMGLTGLNHPINQSTITDSWKTASLTATDPYKNGQIRYPLIEWGYAYDNTPNPLSSTIAVSPCTACFTASNRALDVTQFKPAIQAKFLWDKIFSDAGFTYSSNFLQSPTFTNKYVVSDSTSSPYANFNADVTVKGGRQGGNYGGDSPFYAQKWWPGNTPGPDWGRTGFSTIDFTTLVSGGAAAFNYKEDYYLTAAGGTISSTLTCYLDCFSRGVPFIDSCTASLYLTIMDAETSTIYATASSPIPLGTPGCGGMWSIRNGVATHTFNSTFSVPQGAKVQAKAMIGAFFNNQTAAYRASLGNAFTCTRYNRDPSMYNATWAIDSLNNNVNPGNQLPCNQKKIDFVKSIATKFKLVFMPDPNKEKNFLIEPWTDWIDTGIEVDWTQKIDNEKDFVVKPLFATQPRELEFKEQEDKDYTNDEYQQAFKLVFGRLKIDSGLEVIKGGKNIDTIFAPTPLNLVGNTTNWLIPHLAKKQVVNTITELLPIAPKLRLLHWNGMQPAGSTSSPYTWYYGATGATNQYPLMSSFDSWPVNSTTVDLNWYSTQPAYSGASVSSSLVTQTGNTAFTKYWQRWYDMYYDPLGKQAECYVRLDNKDIAEFAFNNNVFIRDSWWNVTKIDGFTVGEVNNCKVQLVKLKDYGPRSTDIGATAGGTGASGSVNYLTFDSYANGLFTFSIQNPLPVDLRISNAKVAGRAEANTTSPCTGTPIEFDENSFPFYEVVIPAGSSTVYGPGVSPMSSSVHSYSKGSTMTIGYGLTGTTYITAVDGATASIGGQVVSFLFLSGDGSTGLCNDYVTSNTINWSFDQAANSGTFQIDKNGTNVVYCSSNNSGVLSVMPGDLIEVYVYAAAQSGLIAQADLQIVDNGTYIYSTYYQGYPNVGNSYSYTVTGDGTIGGQSYEF